MKYEVTSGVKKTLRFSTTTTGAGEEVCDVVELLACDELVIFWMIVLGIV